eukprot:TRINITY_DN20759_c0_g1_i1.p1 TRINITY_DN20759_c0_g1~~TRINITY_DN20759_c0_g1_i1.p1  ORF type:complete len:367 (-),score=58.40 TRINITY_DN20759_c0_g1_i1:79-1179(-)
MADGHGHDGPWQLEKKPLHREKGDEDQSERMQVEEHRCRDIADTGPSSNSKAPEKSRHVEGPNQTRNATSRRSDASGKEKDIGWHSSAKRSDVAANADTLSLPLALQGMGGATEPTEEAWRCVCVALEHPNIERAGVEEALGTLTRWLECPAWQQAVSTAAAHDVPRAIMHALRRYRNQRLVAALACITAARVASCFENSCIFLKAGALKEVELLMDCHPTHGGVQNVALVFLASLLRDVAAARQAVFIDFTQRVLTSMELTMGREVQRNGLVVLRLLVENGHAQRDGLEELAKRTKLAHEFDDAICKAANDLLVLIAPRFKAVLCWHFEKSWCKLGQQCGYAHGAAELNSNRRVRADGRRADAPQ